ELIECGIPLADQPLPPPFGALEELSLERIPLAARGERRADGVEVDFPHELADVLTLARPGGATRDPARLADGIAQQLRQAERLEIGIAQPDERLAQILGRMGCALALTLARPLGRIRIGVVFRSIGGHCGSNGSGLAAARIKFCPI